MTKKTNISNWRLNQILITECSTFAKFLKNSKWYVRRHNKGEMILKNYSISSIEITTIIYNKYDVVVSSNCQKFKGYKNKCQMWE